jgi:hypothetical protein
MSSSRMGVPVLVKRISGLLVAVAVAKVTANVIMDDDYISRTKYQLAKAWNRRRSSAGDGSNQKYSIF